MVTRVHVFNTLIFMIVTMIVINLYTFALMMSTYAEGSNHKLLKNSVNRQRNNNEVLPEQRDDYSNVSTLRFRRDYHGHIFVSLPRGFQNKDPQFHEKISHDIMVKLDSMGFSSNYPLEGTVRIVGRLKRSFVGSDSAFGVSLNTLNPGDIWKKVAKWPFNTSVYLEATLGQILQFASQAKILQAKCSRRGTQLKLNLILDGGQVALFKPRWYERDIQIHGDVYGGKDRHFGEIAAFYLSQLLGYNNAALTVGRKLNLNKEILPVSTNQLKNTFFYDKNHNHCFYGVCYYCSSKDPVCGDGEILEGALVLLMNQNMKTVPNPWGRTYKPNLLARWQTNMSYCHDFILRNMDVKDREEFILDIVAVSVFDFLIGNGDRHHFDVLNHSYSALNFSMRGHSKRILLIDNGKSFGNAYEDYLDILAPLYQCCRIREPLWSRLKLFQGNQLGPSVDELTKSDPLYPLLTPDHLTALNQRLNIVLAVIEVCLDNHPLKTVIVST